jgi:hypothetical protein
MRSNATFFARAARSVCVASACVLGTTLGVSTASADVTFTAPDSFSCGQCVVLFNNDTKIDQIGNNVVGANNEGTDVFYHSTDVLFAKGGQATIVANGGTPGNPNTFDNLDWFAIPTYTKETFAVNAAESGTIIVAVDTSINGVAQATQFFNWAVDTSGEEKATLFATAGQVITHVFLSGVELLNFRQDRITSGEVTPVPLPPALVLFGTALVGMGFLGRRRIRRGSQVAA